MRKAPDVAPPPQENPYARGFVAGCLVAVLIAAIGVFLVVARFGGGWGKE
jgi:hypothetical protein